MTDIATAEAMAAGFARGLRNQLRAERPDLSWEVTVGPVDRDKLAQIEAKHAPPSVHPPSIGGES